MGKLRDDLEFFRQNGEGFKKDVWMYKGVFYIGCSREILGDGE